MDGPKATDLTESLWPLNVATHSPDLFHNRTILSYEPVKNNLYIYIYVYIILFTYEINFFCILISLHMYTHTLTHSLSLSFWQHILIIFHFLPIVCFYWTNPIIMLISTKWCRWKHGFDIFNSKCVFLKDKILYFFWINIYVTSGKYRTLVIIIFSTTYSR